ncbi:MAG: molecular chaperone DnaJ [Sneathiella sp.]|jgi:DnaJ-class molecular chaperone|uniref:J domain-containing protein n=1 Tax=Sneathiella sp. TaxID=1964365 RepID=UPI000C37E896|nr:J domain-containing protein [Sneathiella sp.]MAL78374.1 molecular chaperone DnaJ [Sneathiella sp.]|tara:strand:- start:1172 stop:2062 length:891 start_codon:yes stop_codon:yes gene_type:complete
MKNLYSILGVAKGASQQDIKSAYRKLAKKHHPDTNPGDTKVEEKFKEISAAYSILGDEKQRARYDNGEIDESGQERMAGFRGGRGSAAGGGFGGAEDIFSEIFGNFRGGGFRGRVPEKGRDRKFAIELDFLQAALGEKRRLTMGDGGRTLDVAIPPGVIDGQQIRLRGQGEAGVAGGPSGDILINVTVRPHSFFRRDGQNVLIELPISLPEAVLGATVKVPTVDGTVNLKVPPGSNTGTTLRLKGKGIGSKDGGRGDQLVKLKVVLPDKQDKELKDWVEKWAESHPYDARSRLNAG